METITEFDNWTPRLVSPEWELFRAIQQMSWQELHQSTQSTGAGVAAHGLFDMYCSVELGLTLEKAVNAPKLSQLAARHGRDVACRLVGLTLLVYFDRLPIQAETGFGAWRLRQTAEWIYDTYGMESLRDLMYAFRRVQGKIVDELPVVMTDYLEWRAAKLEEAHRACSRQTVSPWPYDFAQKLPQQWFLGHPNLPHASKNKEAA